MHLHLTTMTHSVHIVIFFLCSFRMLHLCQLRLLWQNTTDWLAYYSGHLFSYSSGGCEIWDHVHQGVWFLVRVLFLACRPLLSSCVLLWQSRGCGGGGEECKLNDVSSSFYKGANLIMGTPLSRPHLNLITSPKANIPSNTLGSGLQHMNFGAHITFSH